MLINELHKGDRFHLVNKPSAKSLQYEFRGYSFTLHKYITNIVGSKLSGRAGQCMMSKDREVFNIDTSKRLLSVK